MKAVHVKLTYYEGTMLRFVKQNKSTENKEKNNQHEEEENVWSDLQYIQ